MVETNLGLANFLNENSIPSYLEKMIDEAIAQDFEEVRKLTEEDRINDMYKAIMFSFNAAHVEVLYERKVISADTHSIVIPHEQFLFGFRPTDGLCIFSQKSQHKAMLCDGPIRELATACPLTQSLQYVLIPLDTFNVWSYIPVCCSSLDTCAGKTRPLNLRKDLFM